MASIMIENLFKKSFVVNDDSKTLLEHFHANNIDWMHACGAKGRCTTCKVIVKAGYDYFVAETPAERKYRQEGALKIHERLACQAKITGDVTLLAPREYQLPHLRYSDES
jgi:2Fe-2S ferredoxin